jgi:hypothetical protein
MIDTKLWNVARDASIARMRKATAGAKLMRRAGTPAAEAAPRLQAGYGLTDAETRHVVAAVWRPLRGKST